MSTKEIVEMSSDISVILALVFTGIALYHSSRNTNLQRKSLQANMFNDIAGRINKLLDEMPSKEMKPESSLWYIMVLNAFEHFAFFANHNYFGPDMTTYYKDNIINFCNKLEEECPDAKATIDEQKDSLIELNKYYKDHTGVDAPL